MARTDIHRPSAIVPENYEYVATFVFDDFDNWFLQNERKMFEQHREKTGGKFSTHNHKGNCGICGAHCKHYAIFFHVPTNAYIKTGLDCAEKISSDLEDVFKRARNELEAAEKSKSGKMLAWVKLGEAGIRELVETVFDEKLKSKFPMVRGSAIAQDIINKLVQYGSLSDKQYAFLAKLCNDIPKEEELARKRAEIDAARPEAPEGRVVVKGQVLSVKFNDDSMFPAWKMTVQHVDGWMVYCSVPASLDEAKRGDEVEFTVTLKRSEDKPYMAFGSRPTKGAVTKAAQPQ